MAEESARRTLSFIMSDQQQPERQHRMVNFRKALKEFKNIPAGREKSDAQSSIISGSNGDDDVFEEELNENLGFLRDTLRKDAKTILNLDNTLQHYRNYVKKAGKLLTSIFVPRSLNTIESVAAECSSLHENILDCEKLIKRIETAAPASLVNRHLSTVNYRYKVMKDKANRNAAAAKADAERRSSEDVYSFANMLNDSASGVKSVDSVPSTGPEEDGSRKKNLPSTSQNASNELFNFLEEAEKEVDSQATLLDVLSMSLTGSNVDSNKKMKEKEKSHGHGHHSGGDKRNGNLSGKRKSPDTSDGGMPSSKRGTHSQCSANQIIRLSEEEDQDMSSGN